MLRVFWSGLHSQRSRSLSDRLLVLLLESIVNILYKLEKEFCHLYIYMYIMNSGRFWKPNQEIRCNIYVGQCSVGYKYGLDIVNLQGNCVRSGFHCFQVLSDIRDDRGIYCCAYIYIYCLCKRKSISCSRVYIIIQNTEGHVCKHRRRSRENVQPWNVEGILLCVSEFVTALANAKLKIADISSALKALFFWELAKKVTYLSKWDTLCRSP